jgi:hypothetical protein
MCAHPGCIVGSMCRRVGSTHNASVSCKLLVKPTTTTTTTTTNNNNNNNNTDNKIPLSPSQFLYNKIISTSDRRRMRLTTDYAEHKKEI